MCFKASHVTLGNVHQLLVNWKCGVVVDVFIVARSISNTSGSDQPGGDYDRSRLLLKKKFLFFSLVMNTNEPRERGRRRHATQVDAPRSLSTQHAQHRLTANVR